MRQIPNYRDNLKLQKLQDQLKSAWEKLPKDKKQFLLPMIDAAHQNLLKIRSGDFSKGKQKIHYELGMVRSLLENDNDKLIKNYAQPSAEDFFWPTPSVDAGGLCYWTGTDYDATDPFWATIVIAFAETIDSQPSFATNPAVIEIPDSTTIFIISDWGGGNTAAQSVQDAVQNAVNQSDSNYVIHLGDVYYAGTEDNQISYLINCWPGITGRSFALNSNHDMYAHATGYFNTTLANNIFSAQQSTSFFALYNKYFRIVALDTAYSASDSDLYMTGNLIDPDLSNCQLYFLQQQASIAAQNQQNLILMTHHNGLSLDGQTFEPLWSQVTNYLQNIQGLNIYWYWGHEHAAAVYKPQTSNSVQIYPRVCGHSCIPWGIASDLQNNQNVLWYEDGLCGNPSEGANYFVNNGYVTLQLSKASIIETFYNQNGEQSWSSNKTII